MISIICPVYNSSTYLNSCINSVLSQSYENWELILVDDGSTDNSKKICLEFEAKDSRIKYYKKEHSGQWLSREYGIEHSLGEFIIFLDSDDYLEKNALSIIHENILGDDFQCLLFDYNKIYEDGKKTIIGNICNNDVIVGNRTIIDYCFVKNSYISLCMFCFKKSLFDRPWNAMTVEKSIKNQEDFLMLLLVLEGVQVLRVIAHPLYNYRYNRLSVTSTMSAFDYYKTIFISEYIYGKILSDYSFGLADFSEKVICRLAYQPYSYLIRAYKLPIKSETRNMFKQVKETYIFKTFTRGYKRFSMVDKIILFFFTLNFHIVNVFLVKLFR